MEDDIDKAHHVKLAQPIVTSQVRIVIEDDMVTDHEYVVGRVGFVADSDSIATRLLIKRAIDDLFLFKQAD